MTKQEILERYEFELSLAKLLLKDHPWKVTPKEPKLSRAMKCSADHAGNVRLGTNDTREDLLTMFVNLHTYFARPTKYRWQRSALALGLISKLEADDMCECEICGELGPLTTTRRCVDCYKIESAIKEDIPKARYILNRLIEELEDGDC